MRLNLSKGVLASVSLALMIGMSGCAQRTSCELDDSFSKQSSKDIEVAKLKEQVVKQNIVIEKKYELLPIGARAGECYARVLVPEKYVTKKIKVLVKEPSTKLVRIPAKYTYVTKKVLVKEASTKIKTIPAKYSIKTKKVLVKEPAVKLVAVPAVYKTVTQKVLVEPAHTDWKSGRNVLSYGNCSVDLYDRACTMRRKTTPTGEVLCLVRTPAKYKLIRKKVMVKPPCTVKKVIPAVYKTVTQKVLVEPAKEKVINIPAVYKTVKVRKMISPEMTKEIEIPAVYKLVDKKVKVCEAQIKWQQILCETNFTRPRIMMMQRALKEAGYNPGPIDGIIGPKTKTAIRKYQKANGLATGAITLETLRSLGIYR